MLSPSNRNVTVIFLYKNRGKNRLWVNPHLRFHTTNTVSTKSKSSWLLTVTKRPLLSVNTISKRFGAFYRVNWNVRSIKLSYYSIVWGFNKNWKSCLIFFYNSIDYTNALAWEMKVVARNITKNVARHLLAFLEPARHYRHLWIGSYKREERAQVCREN